MAKKKAKESIAVALDETSLRELKTKDDEPLEVFISLLRDMLAEKAVSKGYREDENYGRSNELMAFTDKHFPGHALGEVVYKVVRYQTVKDPQDLVKAAAWAALKWMEATK